MSNDILEQRIIEYSNVFVGCGYKRKRVLSNMRKVLSLIQEESLLNWGRDEDLQGGGISIMAQTSAGMPMVSKNYFSLWEFTKNYSHFAMEDMVAYLIA